jgi:hypothetical protein
MLKNKKFLGKISEQNIRTKSKPLIAEVNSNQTANDSGNQSGKNSIESKEANQ